MHVTQWIQILRSTINELLLYKGRCTYPTHTAAQCEEHYLQLDQSINTLLYALFKCGGDSISKTIEIVASFKAENHATVSEPLEQCLRHLSKVVRLQFNLSKGIYTQCIITRADNNELCVSPIIR
mmetsp:Transcript_9514/g.28742  ORF Transcript_9514/g.28742 Transcript_9514/m.28742 type:complete len:125 (-) Transcript_9514:825-1199(-)